MYFASLCLKQISETPASARVIEKQIYRSCQNRLRNNQEISFSRFSTRTVSSPGTDTPAAQPLTASWACSSWPMRHSTSGPTFCPPGTVDKCYFCLQCVTVLRFINKCHLPPTYLLGRLVHIVKFYFIQKRKRIIRGIPFSIGSNIRLILWGIRKHSVMKKESCTAFKAGRSETDQKCSYIISSCGFTNWQFLNLSYLSDRSHGLLSDHHDKDKTQPFPALFLCHTFKFQISNQYPLDGF